MNSELKKIENGFSSIKVDGINNKNLRITLYINSIDSSDKYKIYDDDGLPGDELTYDEVMKFLKEYYLKVINIKIIL